ncbi:hypothetical protein ACHAW6_008279 [Cyclotella cf. meneghiniana]
MANTQAPIKVNLNMEILHGIEMTEGNTKVYVLQLLETFTARSKQEGCGTIIWQVS